MATVPAEMTAIEITEPGGPEVLRPARRAVPEPGLGEVLIEVTAAGVNRPDTMQRQGLYPPPPGASDLPGLEVSGHVVASGPGAHRYARRAPRSARSPTAALMPNTASRRRRRRCRSRPRSRLPMLPACPRHASRYGPMPSSVRGCGPASGCWSTAAAAASARPRSRSPLPSAFASSPPPVRRKNALPAKSSAPSGRSIIGRRILSAWSRR